MIAIGTMNMGVVYSMIRNVEKTASKQVIHPLIIIGIVESKTSTSFPNRFKILPCGVVSKNDIGDRSTFPSMMWCNLLAPVNVEMYRKRDAKITATACPKPNPPYTPRCKSLSLARSEGVVSFVLLFLDMASDQIDSQTLDAAEKH